MTKYPSNNPNATLHLSTERGCHGCGRVMYPEMWEAAPNTPGKPDERDCPDCANTPR